jgi:tetratricopeptide (TPR) repeat protein
LLVMGLLPGCQLFGKAGPVSPSLATCRQFSQQGIAALERGQWQEAERLLAKAVQSCSTDGESRRNYAEALWHRGAREEAVRQLEEAAVLAEPDARLQVRLAQMRLAMGQVGPARRHVDAALDLDPKLAAAWAMRGHLRRAEGRRRAALADYHRALGRAPEDRGVLLAVAELYRELEDPQQALAILHSLADTYGPGEEPRDVLTLQGEAYAALGRFEEAAGQFAAAAMLEPPSANILHRLGEVELLAGRPEAAAAAAQQALALEPAHQPSRELLGRLQLTAQERDVSRR